MKLLLILLLLGLIASALTSPESYYQSEFVKFMQKHGKSYSHEDFLPRYLIFRKNLEYIDSHNAEQHSFKLEVNSFADLTTNEFRRRNGYNMSAEERMPGKPFKTQKDQPIPDSIDWREIGAVTQVKDQGDCGSCWAFRCNIRIQS